MRERSVALRIWSVLYPAGLYTIFTTAASVIGVVGVAVYLYLTIGVADIDYFIMMLFEVALEKTLHFTLLGAFMTTPFLWHFIRADRKRLKASGQWQIYEKPPAWTYGLLTLLGIFLCYSVNNIIMITGIAELFDSFDTVAEVLYQSNLVFEFVVIGLLLPYVEELIFRGLAYNRLKELVSVRAAIFLSALFFGVYHMNMVQGIYAFVMGTVLAYMYQKFHTLWAPVIIHAAANCLSVIISETEIFVPIYESAGVFLITTAMVTILTVILVITVKADIDLDTVDEEEKRF